MTSEQIKQKAFFDELEKQATVAGRLESWAKGMGRTLGTESYKKRVIAAGQQAGSLMSRDLDASAVAGRSSQDYRANMNQAMSREARIDPFRKSVGLNPVAATPRPVGGPVYA